MTYPRQQVWQHITQQLHRVGIDNATREALLLLRAVCDISATDWLRHIDVPFTAAQYAAIMQAAAQRVQHKPLSRIIGQREFYGHTFMVSPHVLDPRADTESIIDTVQNYVQQGIMPAPQRILDLGAGSGCIGITLATLYIDAVVVAVDASIDALQMAQHNANKLQVANRWHGICGCWGDMLAPQEQFNLIVSNPPYIESKEVDKLPPEVQNYDPRLALDGGSDGLHCYRHIVPQLPRLLQPCGHVIFECGSTQTTQVAQLQRDCGLIQRDVVYDLAGHARCTVFYKP